MDRLVDRLVDRLWGWLSDEPETWQSIAGFIVNIVAVSLCWSLGMVTVLNFLGIRVVAQGAQEIIPAVTGWPIWIIVLFTLFILAFVEEVLFRFPLFFVALIVFGKKWPLSVNLWSIVILSAIFGYLHGNWINIFIQGVIGVFLSFAFLKGGALALRPGKGLLISTTAHFLYNAAVMVLPFIL